MKSNSKNGNGIIYSSIGLMLTAVGLVFMTMDKSPWIYLTLCGAGALLAAFGVIKLMKSISEK